MVGEIAGMSWEEFVQQNIFNPLQMNRTTPFVETAIQTGNYGVSTQWGNLNE
jgi:CubicO group peptidase (beta-lactamase class C family)